MIKNLTDTDGLLKQVFNPVPIIEELLGPESSQIQKPIGICG